MLGVVKGFYSRQQSKLWGRSTQKWMNGECDPIENEDNIFKTLNRFLHFTIIKQYPKKIWMFD